MLLVREAEARLSESRRRRWARAVGSTLPVAAWFALAGHAADAATAFWMVRRWGPQVELNPVWAAFSWSPGPYTGAAALLQEWQFVAFMLLCLAAWRARAWRRGRLPRAGSASLALFAWAFGWGSFVAGAGVNVAVAEGLTVAALGAPLGAWALGSAALLALAARSLMREELGRPAPA